MKRQKPIAWVVLFLMAWGIGPATAHEFWVAPQRYSVQPGDSIAATLRVGRMFRGTELPYLSSGFHSFTVTDKDGTRDVEGIEGDIPAVAYEAETPGLQVITYHSIASELAYDDWEKFLFYLSYEGLEEIAEQHRARGLPEVGFKEDYSRVAKALVQVGPVADTDRDKASGAPLELVAEQNPYLPGLESLSVRLLRLGAPVAHRQVSIFRYDGEVRRHLTETDGDGRATIPIKGGGTFLLNATDLQPVEAGEVEAGEVVWASYWATLTFGLPIVLPEPHPLDPLNKIEIKRAMGIIGQSGNATRETRVSLVALAEPDKARVLAWQPGNPVERRAFAVIRNGSETFEATVDLVAGTLEKWAAVPGIQPPIQSAEWAEAQQLVKEDPRWLAAMAARGYGDVSEIFCESLSAGFFGRPEDRERRLLKMPCYDIAGTGANIYGRPIEGLIAVVDLDGKDVLRVIDNGPLPVSSQTHRLDEDSIEALQDPLKPVRNAAPQGWNFTLDQQMVTWQAWSFHIGFDQRFGPVLSLVTHEDGAKRRSVLYQGHLSEIFVPYMDGDEGWYYRAYMDAGEYGLGALSSPLEPGLDCPENAVFIDGVLSTHLGAPYTRERVICLFERAAPGPLWRHWEALDGSYEGRPATELVVRTIPSVGNYDYVVDWVFTQMGEIAIKVGATGIDAVKGVAARSMTDPGAAKATETGMLVAPNLVAVHHDHFFSFRLDLDVDGPVNSFRRERLVPAALAEGHPRSSLWRLEPIPMAQEGALSARAGPEFWRIENPEVTTTLGHHPSYQIRVGSAATSLLSPEDWPQRRAAFSGETLWVTAREAGERFAGGPYPNQSPGGRGLPAYVDGAAVTETDLVAWPTLGFHHLTRPEDWPVLPTLWHEIRLRPYGFFTENPGLGVRRDFVGEGQE